MGPLNARAPAWAQTLRRTFATYIFTLALVLLSPPLTHASTATAAATATKARGRVRLASSAGGAVPARRSPG